MRRLAHRWPALLVGTVVVMAGTSLALAAEDDAGFFEAKVRPLLVTRCYECHSHGKKIEGGLALDSRAGWQAGGDGGAVLTPGAPEQSRLIKAVEHSDPDFKMPPTQRLADDEIAVLVEWVKRGAPDPREALADEASRAKQAEQEWEEVYQQRLKWWSLQPVAKVAPPAVANRSWPRNEVDQFILAALEAKGLQPACEANKRALARRLSFALVGLPPQPADVERFALDPSPDAYDRLVQSLLDSPHFGERWARHWMDVVHYSDTHGYEWDAPAKNAWMYRDYLIRAFNADLPFNRLVQEQIAGDLLEPRVDAASGLNEAVIGPMALRLGERRHGDNAMFEGITQEAMTNVIDTVTKGFLGTTVGCAQCHNHKLDAVAQRDFYALVGIFMSSRWGVRPVETRDPNLAVIEQLRQIKSQIRSAAAKAWLADPALLVAQILADKPKLPTEDKDKSPAAPELPDSLQGVWRKLSETEIADGATGAAWSDLAGKLASERARRRQENETNLKLVADFSTAEEPAGWQVTGFGMRHGLVRDGELVVADEGTELVAHLLPAGRFSHVWSARLAGALQSPMLDQQNPLMLSVGLAGSKHAAESLIVDHSFHCERMKFLAQPAVGWKTIDCGTGQPHRLVYLELVTKALNNYFPPRTKYGGLDESDVAEPRSWFGVTRVYQHAPGKGPHDELEQLAVLFDGATAPENREQLANRLAAVLAAAVERWSRGECRPADVRLINEALAARWLVNDKTRNAALASLVTIYRETEKQLQPDRVIGSVCDWQEGRNERIGVRGSYTDFGEEVPRGNIRFLGGATERALPQSSGRLELARAIVDPGNPLTARVFVNRVWHYLYGEGLVRTPDDFGKLGERPSHPELLDWLATRFIEDGWSVKKLVRLLVTAQTWRQASMTTEQARSVDPENRLWHHVPLRRLDAESIRDAMLAVSGRLDPALFGPPIDPHRVAEDAAKRLFSGPLDGNGRRSLYLKMTIMEPPKFLALFNQPMPKLTAGKRDATNVPDQSLALLNDPFVVAMSAEWGKRAMQDGAESPELRVAQMFAAAFARPPQPEETARLVRLARQSAELRGAPTNVLLDCPGVWQDVAHALVNLKEFLYVE